MIDNTDDEYLDEYESEAQRRAAREARLLKMRRSKRRQQFLRQYAIFVLIGIVVVAAAFAIVIVTHARSMDDDAIDKSKDVRFAIADDEGGTPEDISSETDTIEDVGGASDDGTDTADDSDGTDGSDYTDSEFGPYAEVYSAEKELFFDGYEVTGLSEAAYPSDESVLSTYALLICADDGTVIAAKGADTRIYPASMTKIMTILVAAERVTDLDDSVLIDISITDYVYKHDCSAVGFAEGERVCVRDLMYGTILPSGADAAIALAEYVAGSEDRFVDMMNDKLDELGLSDTAHFTNCIGVYDDDHYCTLTDMAMIMKAAVENELARSVMQAHIYTTSSTPEHPDGIEISNWFLRRIEDKDTRGEVICAKTGFVNESGCCGASYEISETGAHYICVTADAWSPWRCIYDHVALYDTYVE